VGLVVPKGWPRYVKGNLPIEHPKEAAKLSTSSSDTLMGIREDFP
jgi:hypothetical protein